MEATGTEPQLPPGGFACLRSLSATYVWWKTPDEAMQFPARVAAQVMNLGTFDDITAMIDAAGEAYLRHVLQSAEAGQLDQRSWNYWHLRLGLLEPGKQPIPRMPVRKTA